MLDFFIWLSLILGVVWVVKIFKNVFKYKDERDNPEAEKAATAAVLLLFLYTFISSGTLIAVLIHGT